MRAKPLGYLLLFEGTLLVLAVAVLLGLVAALPAG